MAIYSHSKISTFEQCPLKFKFRYIDKIVPEIEKTIEAHLGSAVHAALEWLYKKVLEQKIPTMDELIIQYQDSWKKDFSENIYIKKQEFTEKDYFNKGLQFIIDYYIKNHPFQDNTLEIEKKISLIIHPEKNHKLIGFIDRLVFNKETNEYEIHDYKTADSMPSREKVESDRQLAIYSMAVKELFGKEKEVCLIWHYLAHNKKICLKKTQEQLQETKKQILDLIEKIESEKQFPACVSKLCDWCEYQTICPEFNKQQNSNPPPLKQNKNNNSSKYPTISKYLKDV